MSILVQLPDAAQSFVEEQVSAGQFSSPAEYIASLVESARREAARERVEALLIEGLESGPGIEITPEYWNQKKEEWTRKYGPAEQP